MTRQEHEHCTANMLADLAQSSACDILGGRETSGSPITAWRIMSPRPDTYLVLSATPMGTAWPKSHAKAPRLADRLEAWGAAFLFGVFKLLPLDCASAVGGALARRIGPFLVPGCISSRMIIPPRRAVHNLAC